MQLFSNSGEPLWTLTYNKAYQPSMQYLWKDEGIAAPVSVSVLICGIGGCFFMPPGKEQSAADRLVFRKNRQNNIMRLTCGSRRIRSVTRGTTACTRPYKLTGHLPRRASRVFRFAPLIFPSNPSPVPPVCATGALSPARPSSARKPVFLPSK
jgi:hypothetical protein